MYEGIFSLSTGQVILITLILTHITCVSVTIYLHRNQSHQSVDLHPILSHFFRFWLWLTTGMVTKEWTAVHRKHHAMVETEDDPHSPQVHGLLRVLFRGVGLYHDEAINPRTLEVYGRGTPDDWMENHFYLPFARFGNVVMYLINIALFGLIPGIFIGSIQLLWIPFWAAGVINGIGHYFGYRNFHTKDSSTNIFPWGILIAGEELHNNHHAYASSARLSNRWFEFDIGWMYICIFEFLGLANVNKVSPKIRFDFSKSTPDLETLKAVVIHRLRVMQEFQRAAGKAYRAEIRRLRSLGDVKAQEAIAEKFSEMKKQLVSLWEASQGSQEQLVQKLREWCENAEASGYEAIAEFSRKLRAYAVA